MAVFRKTAIVQFELPSTPMEESLPLTRERAFGVYLTLNGQLRPALPFRSPMNDETWREFTRALRNCNTNANFHDAEFIRALGRDLYAALAALSSELRAFLEDAGEPRRLVLQSKRPELHVLPWVTLYDTDGKLLAAGDLSIVQSWEGFSDQAFATPATLNLLTRFGSDTNKVTAASLKALPPEITRDANGAPDIVHIEEHGNPVLSRVGGQDAWDLARRYPLARLALLWSCYSSAANSWGESPALALHRGGANLVLSFQAELNLTDAAAISETFYADVFGAAATRDPESALVRIRTANFEKKFDWANWASMTVYLRAPLDFSALPLNGPRVPVAAWSDAVAVPVNDVDAGNTPDPWADVKAALQELVPGSVTKLAMPALADSRAGRRSTIKIPRDVFANWRGTVIRLDGADDPVKDNVLLELGATHPKTRGSTGPDELAWFLKRIATFGAPLLVWTNARVWHEDFLRALCPSSNLTFLLLCSEPEPPSLPDLVYLNRLAEARTMYESQTPSSADEPSADELRAAYYAYARSEKPKEAIGVLQRIEDPAEKQLLKGNFISRFHSLPEAFGQPLSTLEQRRAQTTSYREALRLAAAAGDRQGMGSARHELAYYLQSLGRTGSAETLYRAALEDFERSPSTERRWSWSLGRLLRDWAELIAEDPARNAEASSLIARALAMQIFYNRPLEIAYALSTSARIARSAGRFEEAVVSSIDAANRFEECDNWRGWSEAVGMLLQTLSANREPQRMLGVIGLAQDKIARSNVTASKRSEIERSLLVQTVQAHWLAGDLTAARAALTKLDSEGDTARDGSERGTHLDRLRRFLAPANTQGNVRP